MTIHNTDILIIGAGPSGMVAAITPIQHNPTKKVTVFSTMIGERAFASARVTVQMALFKK